MASSTKFSDSASEDKSELGPSYNSRLIGTKAFKRFADEHKRLGRFLTFVLSLATTYDENRKVAIRALAMLDEDSEELDIKLQQATHDGAVAAFGKHFFLTKEMLVCRAVDNYLCYFTELLSMIFRTKPETLRSGEQIRVDRVLSYDSMVELIAHIADKKVNELAYQSMVDLNSYFGEKLGLKLFDTDEQERAVIQIVLLRNLLVHARGQINERFLTLCPEYSGKVGDEIKLTTDRTFQIVSSLLSSVRSIDSMAINKYHLPDVLEFDFEDLFTLIRPVHPPLATKLKTDKNESGLRV